MYVSKVQNIVHKIYSRRKIKEHRVAYKPPKVIISMLKKLWNTLQIKFNTTNITVNDVIKAISYQFKNVSTKITP